MRWASQTARAACGDGAPHMKKLERMTKQGAQAGLECLLAICRDEEQKAADRISAAKALIDYGRKAEAVDEGAVRVVLEGVLKEYLV